MIRIDLKRVLALYRSARRLLDCGTFLSVRKGAVGVTSLPHHQQVGLMGGSASEGFGGFAEIVSLKWDCQADPFTHKHSYQGGPWSTAVAARNFKNNKNENLQNLCKGLGNFLEKIH